MAEAQAALSISKSTLEVWVKAAKLQQAVKKQRMEDDMRSHYLTREQLDRLAMLHRRKIAAPDNPDPLARLEAVDAALTERIEALEARVAALEGKQGELD